MFFVYKPKQIPDIQHFIALWQKLAKENGLKEIFFVAIAGSLYNPEKASSFLNYVIDKGFDALNVINAFNWTITDLKYRIIRSLFFKKLGVIPDIRPYRYEQFQCPIDNYDKVFPTILPNWDHTPRTGKKGIVLNGSTPEAFQSFLHQKLEIIKNKPFERRFLIIKSWNEWAEGNYLEPDLRFGTKYLEALKKELNNS